MVNTHDDGSVSDRHLVRRRKAYKGESRSLDLYTSSFFFFAFIPATATEAPPPGTSKGNDVPKASTSGNDQTILIVVLVLILIIGAVIVAMGKLERPVCSLHQFLKVA